MEEIVRILNTKKYFVERYNDINPAIFFTIKDLLPFIERSEESVKKLEMMAASSIKIDFKDKYKFDEMPKKYSYFQDIKQISKLIYFYEDDVFNLKNTEKIKEEEQEGLKLLKEWAIKLPERKED